MVQKNNRFAAVHLTWHQWFSCSIYHGNQLDIYLETWYFFVNVKLNLDIYRKDTIILTFLTFPWKHVWYHAGELYNLKLDNKTCCDSSEDDEGVDTGFNLQCQFLTMLNYFYNIYMILSVMSVNVSDDHYQCKNSYRMFKNGSGKKIIYRLQKNTEMYIVLNVSFIPFIFFWKIQ